MALQETGVVAVVKNLSSFLGGVGKMNTGLTSVGETAQKTAGTYRDAMGKLRDEHGKFVAEGKRTEGAFSGLSLGAGKFKLSAGNLGSTVGKLGSDLSSLSGGVAKLGSNLGGALLSSVKGASSAFLDLGNHVLKLGTIAGGTALAGVTALGAGLSAFAIDGISKAKDLDQQIANIAATMGKTKEEIGPLRDLITQLSLDPELVVNTSQAADMIEKLGQNGATTEQIMGGLAKQTIQLANATGNDFVTAAAIATDAMAIFKKENIDAGQVADSVTGILVNSKFNITDYAAALAQSGAVAAGAGISFEDLSTAIAGVSSNFASGTDAGTGLKTLIQRLSAPTDKLKAVMEQYDIGLFNADGSTKNLAEVSARLNEVLFGTMKVTTSTSTVTDEMAKNAEKAAVKIPELTEKIGFQQRQLEILTDDWILIANTWGEGSNKAKKKKLEMDKLSASIADNQSELGKYQDALAGVQNAQTNTITTTKELTQAERSELETLLGGADAVRAVTGLADLGAEGFENLSEKVNAGGQAAKSAATRVDSLAGAMEIFKGIIESIQIEIGTAFLPLLREITVAFTEMATKVGPRVIAFFGEVAAKTTAFFKKIQGHITTFKNAGLFGEKTDSGAGVGLLHALGLSSKTVSQVQTIFNDIKKAVTAFQEVGLFNDRAGGRGAMRGGLLTALGIDENIQGKIKSIMKGISSAFQSAFGFISKISWGEIKGALIGIAALFGSATITAGIVAIGSALFSLVTPVNLLIAGAATLGAAWAGNWGDIQGITTKAIDKIKEAITAFKTTGLFDFQSGSMGSSQGLLGALGIGPDTQAMIQSVLDGLGVAFANISNAVSQISWEDVSNAFVTLAEALAGGAVVVAIGTIATAIAGLVTPATALIGLGALIGAAWVNNWGGIQEKVQSAWETISAVFSAIQQTIIAQVLPQLSLAFNNITQVLANFGLTWGDVGMAFLTSAGIVIAGIIGLFVGLTGAVASAAATLSSYWLFLQDSVSTTFAGIQNVIIGTSQFFIQIFQGEFAKAFAALGQVVQGVVEIIVGSMKTIAAMITLPLVGVLSFLSGFVKTAVNFFQTLYDKLVGNSIIPDLVNRIVSLFQTLPGRVLTSIMDLASKAASAMQELANTMVEKITSTKWKELGGSVIEGILKGIESKAGNVKSKLISLVSEWIGAVGSALGFGSPAEELVPYGASIIQGLIVGLTSEGSALGKALTDTVLGSIKNLDRLGETTKAVMGRVLTQFVPTLNQEIMAGTTHAGNLINRLIQLGKETGTSSEKLALFNNRIKNIDMAKLIEQIKEAAESLRLKLAAEFANFAQSLNSFGQMALSRWADPLQKQIDLLQEFTDAQNDAAEATAKAAEEIAKQAKEIEENNEKVRELEGEREDLKQQLTDQAKKHWELANALGADSAEAKEAQRVYQQLFERYSKVGDEIGKVNAETSELEQEIAKLKEIASGVFDPDQLVKIGNLWIRAGDAQDLLTRKLEEQKKVQEEQAKLAKQQADLAFLQSQLSLIDMIRKAGLDPAQIFQGITFGLTASIPDMVQATQNAVQALINQVNGDLGIASESKVMAYAGRMTMAGLAQGITQAKGMVTKAISTPIMAMPQMATAGAGQATTISPAVNFNGPITISNGMDLAALGQYVRREVSQAIKR